MNRNTWQVSAGILTRGATCVHGPSRRLVRLFQSTRPRGARPKKENVRPEFLDVSIHAPARGATLPRRVTNSSFYSFNPRAREGRDGQTVAVFVAVEVFQSTRPRGARPIPQERSSDTSTCFNPRAREGRDGSRSRKRPSGRCFNPRAREGRDSRKKLTRYM